MAHDELLLVPVDDTVVFPDMTISLPLDVEVEVGDQVLLVPRDADGVYANVGVQSLQAQVKAYEAAESSTKLALEATQLGYKVGVRVNLDVLNAQTQLYTTQRDLAKARYDVLVNSLKLRQASGQLRPEDVTAINTLLAK